VFFKFLKHGSTWAYRLTTWLLLILVLCAGAAVVALRFFVLPVVDDYKTPIAQSIAQTLGQTVEIGRIEGDWRDFRPQLRLFDVRIHESGGLQTLAFEHVDTALSWRSLIAGNIVFKRIEIADSNLEIRRDSLGTLWVAGEPIARREPGSRSRLADWLSRQGQIVVHDARISWIDEMRAAPTLVVDDVTIEMDNAGSHHRFIVTGAPPVELASAVTFSADFSGERVHDIASWSGQIFGGFEYANLAVAQQWVSLPIEFDSGLGQLSVWMDVSESKVTHVVAEANLVNVGARLAPDLEPLSLANLSGRFQWDGDEAGQTFAMSQLTLETFGGIRLPPADIEIRKPYLTRLPIELKVAALELGPAAALSKSLPVDASIVEMLARFEPDGVVEDLTASWVPPEGGKKASYEITARFSELAIRPVDNIPGFSGMSGAVTVSAAGGTVSLKTETAQLEFPTALVEPVDFDYLDGEADWKVDGEQLRVNIRNASFANEHAAGNASGTYSFAGKDKGDIDLRAILVRSSAEHIWRYFPHIFPNVHSWLKQGLVAGHSEDVRLHLAGPLHKFPFADKSDGIFDIKVAVQNASVRLKAGWPLIEGVSGDFLVSGDRINIEPRSGVVMGLDVSDSHISVVGLGSRRERVIANVTASGEVDQLLRFIASSPVARYTKGSTANMSGVGIGSVDVRLDLPVRSPADVAVEGSVDLAGQYFTVSPSVPVLRNYSARVEFSEDRVALRNGLAQALGGDLRFGSRASPGGTMEIGLSGTVAATSLAEFTRSPLLARLYGSAKWNGQLIFRKGESHLHAESTLVGVGSRLPAPMDKNMPTALPIQFDVRSKGSEGHEYGLDVAKIGHARWMSQDGVIGRGAIEFGGVAALPPRGRGIGVGGEIALLDVDGWRDVFANSTSQSTRGGFSNFDLLDLKIDKLRLSGRLFSDLQIEGKRDSVNWKVVLAGPQVDGIIAVSPNTKGGHRVNARFSTLAVPPREVSITAIVPEEQAGQSRKLPPALNAVVEDLRFEGKLLGRLELLAEPDSDTGTWQLERLAISNPDGRMDVKGKWLMAGRPRTEYVARLEAFDIGKFFKRLGYGDTIVGGSGTLIGPVSWLGSPFHPNLPTLTGNLKLNAVDGRFVQVDPGAAQLLGILSLQALPRRMILDFKDVFVTGFSFDSITANATVTEGIVQTQDFQMDGVAAQVKMNGIVNLAAETQILDVHVRPQLSSAAAVAGAVVISPIVGVAVLLAQKALGDPVEIAASRAYHVTGAWANPRVERIKRESERSETPSKGGR
jgi:uncharacterized protein (TIGR02099 family)